VLLLDDCLSSVDTHTEEAILAGLRAEMRRRTTLIVSHRVSAVREAENGAEFLETIAQQTGIRARDWEEIGRLDISNSVTDEEAVLFLATGLEAGQPEPEGTERLQVRLIPFDDALALVAGGGITDAISVLGLQRIALRRAGLVE